MSSRNESSVAAPGSRSTSKPRGRSAASDRGVRRNAAYRERQVDTEPVDQLVGEQRDEIGIPTEPGRVRREQLGTHGGTARCSGTLQDRYPLAPPARRESLPPDRCGRRRRPPRQCRPSATPALSPGRAHSPPVSPTMARRVALVAANGFQLLTRRGVLRVSARRPGSPGPWRTPGSPSPARSARPSAAPWSGCGRRSRRRSSVFVAISTSASVIPASPSASSPSRRSATNSVIPVPRMASTGNPAQLASSAAIPNDSRNAGATKRSACR